MAEITIGLANVFLQLLTIFLIIRLKSLPIHSPKEPEKKGLTRLLPQKAFFGVQSSKPKTIINDDESLYEKEQER